MYKLVYIIFAVLRERKPFEVRTQRSMLGCLLQRILLLNSFCI